jgi:low affinity Fe/Cu permease
MAVGVSGSFWVFAAAAVFVICWALTGPVLGFGTTWQLVINTASSIVTLLMVFLIQNAQNRDTKAIQVKLDELIRAVRGTDPDLIDLEGRSEEELEELHEWLRRRAEIEDSAARRR